eukprot:TRINITY_DN19930_c0_g1_i1.p1 TRINITY_DN19930_c0_g1~~TRINITY_DN19930_c0_g1_i1.p1  ORF type:complete len:256 (+),score=65.15 TRINITY_DN19930_c0_g1_i1:53-820(+)
MGKHVLAFDLDGTFLGGPQAGRDALYSLIEQNRHACVLIYATGRQYKDVVKMKGLPQPDFFVCDVGASVYHGNGEYVEEVQQWINTAWGTDSAERISKVVADVSGLRYQNDLPEYEHGRRVSFCYDKKDVPEETLASIKQDLDSEGFHTIISHGHFIDVLPGGVGKGPTLQRLLALHDHPVERLVIAGDTYNDYTMFELAQRGLAGIMVSNGDAQLREAVASLENVFHATAPGAAGILEGLHHLGIEWARDHQVQ